MFRALLAVGFLVAYFCAMAWPGLISGLGNDDLMNMTFAFRDGWVKVLKGNFLFYSSQYRPLGSLFYLTGYELFGPVSLPLRIVGISCLAINLALLYRLGRVLTGSAEVGLLAAMFIAWHGNLAPLFFGSGNIYDVLAFLFYIAAVGYYVGIRQGGHQLNWRQVAVLGVLHICALNSKEFTATLPMVLLAYELIFHWRDLWKPSLMPRGVALTVLLSGAYTLGKIFGADSLVAQEAYAPRLSVDAYAQACGVYLNDLFYRTDIGTPKTVAVYLLAVILSPLLMRSRRLGFAAALTLLGSLPVMLIPPRGLASSYVSMGGLVLWVAILLVELRGQFQTLISADERERRYLQTALFVLAALFCLKNHAIELGNQVDAYTKDSRNIALAQRSLNQHPEWFARGRRVLVMSDPFTDRWAPIFLGILYSHNMEFVIHRLVDMEPKPDETKIRQYDVYLRWENDGFTNRPL